MPSTFVQRRMYSLLWDGTNGQEVADLFTAVDVDDGTYTVVEQVAGSHLTLQAMQGSVNFGQQTYFADKPYFVIDLSHGRIDVLTESQLSARFMPTTQVPGPTPVVPTHTLTVGVGAANIGVLLLGGSANVVVPLDVTMPDTSYAVKWRAVAGAQVLSMLTLNGTITKTTTQVTIPVKATGVASVAGVMLVEAYRLSSS